MYKITSKKPLNATVTQMEIEAPLVARKAKPGQFIILRVDEEGERIPLTVAGTDPEKGTVKIIFQIVGATTEKLNRKNEGDFIQDFVGPLGNATELPGAKKVAVVGGGVAGITAMTTLVERGHDVTLYEKTDHLGGNVLGAAAPPFKIDCRDYLDWLLRQAEKCPARKIMNTDVTKEILDAEHYDAIVIAVGSEPIIPKVPGIDKPHVHWAPDAETGSAPCGDNVVVIGGATVGTEAAIDLAMRGKHCTVLMRSRDEDHSYSIVEADVLDLSAKQGVVRMGGWVPIGIRPTGVLARCAATGEEREFPADTVLIATGLKPRRAEALRFAHCCPETNFFIIGDAAGGRDIRSAVFQAFEAVRSL